MTTRYASRVFVAAEAWKAKLDAATFPPHPVTGLVPSIEFGDEDPSSNAEKICVLVNPDDAVAEWARISPAGRDEIIILQAVIRSYVDSVETSADAWDRIEALTAVVEGTAYNTTTQRVVELGYDGEVAAGLIFGVQPYVWSAGTSWFGSCVVSLRSQASI